MTLKDNKNSTKILQDFKVAVCGSWNINKQILAHHQIGWNRSGWKLSKYHFDAFSTLFFFDFFNFSWWQVGNRVLLLWTNQISYKFFIFFCSDCNWPASSWPSIHEPACSNHFNSLWTDTLFQFLLGCSWQILYKDQPFSTKAFLIIALSSLEKPLTFIKTQLRCV